MEFFKQPKIAAVLSLLSYLTAVILAYLEDKIDLNKIYGY